MDLSLGGLLSVGLNHIIINLSIGLLSEVGAVFLSELPLDLSSLNFSEFRVAHVLGVKHDLFLCLLGAFNN